MRLSAHDASFLYTETASGPMHSTTFSVLDGPATFQEVFDFYAARIHLVPRLRQRLAFVPFNLAHPKWVDDPDFNLANHVKPHVVPKTTKFDRAIEIALELGEALLDRNRPLWVTYVIENVQGKTLLAQMSHHSFVDGATAVAMAVVLTDNAPDAPPPVPPVQAWSPPPMPSAMELWREAIEENARINAEQTRRNFEGVGNLTSLNQRANTLIERMSRPVMQAPWNASLIGPKRKIATLTYRLDEFRPIRRALGGTINDIAVAVAVEGAARYLESHGEVVEGQFLRLMCPVDVRDDHQDPLHMTGNRVSAMFPVLQAAPMTMAERYAAVREELDEIKKNGEPEIMDELQQTQPHVPPLAMAQTLSVGTPWDPTAAAARAPLPVLPHAGGPRPQQSGFNFTCTNVPGPPYTQYVAGYEVLSSIGTLMLGGNLGLGVGIGSYDGAFTFSFTADPRLLPDLGKFASFVAETLTELMALAEASGGGPPGR